MLTPSLRKRKKFRSTQYYTNNSKEQKIKADNMEWKSEGEGNKWQRQNEKERTVRM
jgi:hypothetical protein